MGQGLLLPQLIRWIRVEEIDDIRPELEQLAELQIRLRQASLKLIMERHAHHLPTNELVANLHKQLESDLHLTEQRLESFDCNSQQQETYQKVLTDVLGEQREELVRLRSAMLFSDDVIRKQADQLDLDEARMNLGPR